jgi:uncharacterized protein
MAERFIFRSRIPESAEAVYRWHAAPGALERLTPPWESVRVLQRTGGIEDGGQAVIAVRAGGFWRRWVAVHQENRPGRQFCDVQIEGPFARWRHCHRFVPDGPDACVLEDDIEYALPLGLPGKLLGGPLVRQKLARMFRYRHQVTAADLSLHRTYTKGKPMKILISGATGLVGSALAPFLTTGGHQVVRLGRGPSGKDDIHWDPSRNVIDAAKLEGFDAVVHLAGENIAARRWNAEQKARIRDSRVQGTRLLAETLGKLQRPPRALIAASAIGFYGDRGDEVLNESSAAGTGFLADVCRDWEAATASAAGIRVVNLRFGVILSPKGGALAQMLTPFRMGVGGRIGSGKQWMSWIALDDVIGAIHHALATESLRGPVNAVAPQAVTNREFTKTLGQVLHRPTFLPMPAFAARLALGEMADELLLASARVEPKTLLESNYRFVYGNLEDALRHLLGKEPPQGTESTRVAQSQKHSVEARN